MVTQYPDILKYKTIPADSIYNQSTGTWSTPSPSDFSEVKCRAEMNGEGKTISSNDGTELKYSFTIYINKTVPALKFGQNVEVIAADGSKLFSGTVQAFKRGQMNARLWV